MQHRPQRRVWWSTSASQAKNRIHKKVLKGAHTLHQPAKTEPNTESKTPADGCLVTSYQTKASTAFEMKGSRHRNDYGRLLNSHRPVSAGFWDTNQLVHPHNAITVLEYSSRDPQFTPMEQLKFALAFRDTPAQLGIMAQYLPGRTTEEALSHYYLHKWDGRFKNESRQERYARLPGRWNRVNNKMLPPHQKELDMDCLPEIDMRLRERRKAPVAIDIGGEEYHNNGRLKRKSTKTPAGPLEEERLQELVPINMHIAELKERLNISGSKVFEKTRPPPRKKRVIIPPPFRLELLADNFRHPFHLTDGEIMHWLRSETVLPLASEFFITVVHDGDLYAQLHRFLEEDGDPYTNQIGDIAYMAQEHKLWTVPGIWLNHQEILMKCSQFAYRIACANYEFFSARAGTYSYAKQEAYLDAAFLLLFALDDFEHDRESGFFAVLLRSELAGMVRPAVRERWEQIYTFEGEPSVYVEHLTDSDEDEHEPDFEIALPLRTKREWTEVLDYEGVDGKSEDWDETEGEVSVARQLKMARMDSGLAGHELCSEGWED